MASSEWCKSNNLIDFINKSFTKFDFFQLVYILETLKIKELSFLAQIDLNYESNTVINLKETIEKYLITTNLFSLVGPSGLLPAHYSADLIKNDHQHALEHILNIFNSELLKMYYLAWRKYKLYLPFDTNQLNNTNLTDLLKQISGFLPMQQSLDFLPANLQQTLWYFCGFNIKSAKTIEGLEHFLMYYLKISFKIEPFKGCWLKLAIDNCSKLPSNIIPQGQFNVLSKNCVIGQRVWHSQNRFCVVINIINNQQFQNLLSEDGIIKQAKRLIRLYLGEAYQFFIKVTLQPEVDVSCKLSSSAMLILSRNIWLNTAEKKQKEFFIFN